jgi:hypothetical protein
MAKEHGEAAPENEPNGRKRIPLTTACEYRKESPLAAGGTSRPGAGELAGGRVSRSETRPGSTVTTAAYTSSPSGLAGDAIGDSGQKLLHADWAVSCLR